jgi:hypothetical protein
MVSHSGISGALCMCTAPMKISFTKEVNLMIVSTCVGYLYT